MKNRTRTIKIFISILFLWVCGHLIYITIDGLTDKNTQADIAVILGNKVNEDGTLSERLEKRMECGLALYHSGRVKKIIVSGGLGKEGFYEGDKMKEYLIKHNVPDSIIIVDNLGSNTLATVNNTLKLKDSLNFQSIIVVSQYFHLTRTKMLFRKHHFENVSGVSPKYFELRDIYSLLREFVAYYVE
ncbi:vancomycin permeability regulator SanA [Flavobacterium arsenatis]|uniref:Vancomycin permeability regulator SanA n=1 Tax=Flavobacterium arsenatis TaxID=1484332 RepID=A0ABU1TUN0_9FLAO|nr:YdcF family protein [Flavobacterium arsenatis]MDR6969593.1 vancomycin permeability regulator SanA [Flavobacterium arsenatis]